MIDLDGALLELASFAPRQAQLLELRFFGGPTLEQAASQLNVSPGTADKDWALAKAWLKRRLESA